MDSLETLRKIIAGKRDLAIDLQTALTAVPALGPQNGGSGEAEKARVLASWLTDHGLSPVARHPAPDPRVPGGERPNLLVTIPGTSRVGSFWIMSHMDIVPPGESSLWSSDPYTLVVKGDRIIGRGVEDNQQGMVSSIVAALALKEAGLAPTRTVKLLFVSDEETGSDLGAAYLAEHTDLFKPEDVALVPDGGNAEGSQIEVAEKSILWLKFRIHGVQCHASTPQKGVNAFEAGSALVMELTGLRKRYPASDPLFDPPVSTFTPTKKEANVPNVNTLPGDDVFYLDCRVLPRENLDEVMGVIRGMCDAVVKRYGVTIDIEEVQRASSPSTPADAPFIASLKKVVKQVYGVEGVTAGIGGGTVGAFLRKKGIPTAVWSKVEESAHQPNEYCLMDNLLGDALVMARLMLEE